MGFIDTKSIATISPEYYAVFPDVWGVISFVITVIIAILFAIKRHHNWKNEKYGFEACDDASRFALRAEYWSI